MGVFDTIGKIFRREHVYVLALNRRGRPLEIDTFKAKNLKEAIDVAKEIIDGLNPDEIPDITKYKTFRIIEDTGKTKLIKNPFFTEKDINDISGEEITKLAIASVAEKIPDVIGKSIDMVASIQTKVMTKVLDEMTEALAKSFKKQLGVEHDPLETLKVLLLLIQNKDKLKEALKEFREAQAGEQK